MGRVSGRVGETNAIIFNREAKFLSCARKRHGHVPRPIIRKGVLQSIHDKLISDQPYRNRLIERNRVAFGLNTEANRANINEGRLEVYAKLLDKGSAVRRHRSFGAYETPLNLCHDADPFGSGQEVLTCRLPHISRMKVKQ
jgi:hypothetical protein